MAEPDRGEVAGLILAGGQGSRMNGQDKGLVVLHGEPMVAHVARRLAPQVGRLIISANRHADRYGRYGEVVADGDPGLGAWQGPLMGIAAALLVVFRQRAFEPGVAASNLATPQWLVVAPCDTPFLPADMASRLIGAALAAQSPMAYAVAHGQRHSACMALRTSLRPGLLAYLQGGDRKVGLWQARTGAVQALFDDAPPHAFMNVNTPEDLAQAERYASQ
ncbi:molybdenum cofactor guanylyltransferase MobA [Achromobacter sp. NFACC18-2]|uniref:molybdenum cofactor guanylyltransferase MobA n=1 Tax=Achromobacter sp. NFACC18-2 TaxID=1564112 RepID=UPI0008D6338F|nr:molybdenum cofactor guanylyltransferase MobA [Achromobacter sp. NFACC18-2]SEK10211.1 molybdenum cofactor guanylyltransferase [Achromobacter sp. NFACC18-2]